MIVVVARKFDFVMCLYKHITMEAFKYTGDKLDLDLINNFLTPEDSYSLFTYLESECKWSSKINSNKRVNCNYGDEGLYYELNIRNKTIRRNVTSWETMPILKTIRDHISEITNTQYNYCVIQRYPNGSVGINPHRDREMVPGTTIAGLSLGSTRELIMSRYEQNLNIELKPGSLYVFNPPTNDNWSHSIKKDEEETKPRISITYRLLP